MTGNTHSGIQAYGAFVPRLRIPRAAIADAHAWALPGLKGLGRGERALCSWDEDSITMAVQAARDCLASVPAVRASELTFASTTSPFADLQNATLISQALRLDAGVPCQDVSGSTRAGLRALVQALESSPGRQRLVVAADRRHARPGSIQELTYGAAAAAVLTGSDDLLARYLGHESVSLPFVDHFRESGTRYDYHWEERWIRDEGVLRIVPAVAARLLERLGLAATRISWFALAGVPYASEKMVAKALGIGPERVLPDLQAQVGDCGTPQALLQLAGALELGQPGDIILIGAFGLGCEFIALEMTDDGNRPIRGLAAALAERREERSYTKMLTFSGELRLDWGPRAEVQIKASLTQQYRTAPQTFGFVGGKCRACSQVQFPSLPVCIKCAATNSQDPFPLPDEAAHVATVSADWLQYYPAPPLYVGLVQFTAGARVLMEIVDVPAAGIEVGAPLRFEFRLKAHDDVRNYGRYFWKALPLST